MKSQPSVEITDKHLPPLVEVTKDDWRKFRFHLENGDVVDVNFDGKGVLHVRSFSFPLVVLPRGANAIVVTTDVDITDYP